MKVSTVQQIKMQTPRRASAFFHRMRDSIQSRCGSVKPSPAALIRAAFKWVRIPIPAIKNADTQKGICIFWQRMRDSNPRERSQSPVCYRYTNPLCNGFIIRIRFQMSSIYFPDFSKSYRKSQSSAICSGGNFRLSTYFSSSVVRKFVTASRSGRGGGVVWAS